MVKFRSLIASMVAATALTTGFVGSAAAAEQSSVSAQGSKCATVWASNGKGSVHVCWNWHKNSRGTYDGTYRGKFYDYAKDGRWVILQARWAGRGWTPVKTAANGESFSADFYGISGLNFRACLTGGYCGSPAS
ncbi:hypothetical protein G3260_006321 [Streptomyces albus]|uniref:Uncharacterized protein n=1 Tax=Streptomyces albus TaxID=1888 RepID=A0A6C1CD31_9ACTN|nr:MULTISPECIES: hypothetical protein [Streptomyces]KPC90245.1 hypothetical protein ADL27_36840 [Streptomyces sp. NRRL F-6602]QID39462.1 hypothetical protein G3260_006321 [Streptomyces albus]TGG86197.1 hypothetical protein D8771_07320 [Streptomyces albus]UVN53480.1 hypothetical protein NR995_02375 [Streptomyces albus]